MYLARLSQGRGDIGVRMARLLASSPYGPVVLIGSDIPGVRAAYIAEAFKVLGGNDVVFGPADDGGFWLVGVRRARDVRGLFSRVRWSSPHALADTLANLHGWRVGYVARLSDVDDAVSCARVAHFGACITLSH